MSVRRKHVLRSPLDDRDHRAAGRVPDPGSTGLAHHGPQLGIPRQRTLGIHDNALPPAHGVHRSCQRRSSVLAFPLHRDLPHLAKQMTGHGDIKELSLPEEARVAPRVIEEVGEGQRIGMREMVGHHDAATVTRQMVLPLPPSTGQSSEGGPEQRSGRRVRDARLPPALHSHPCPVSLLRRAARWTVREQLSLVSPRGHAVSRTPRRTLRPMWQIVVPLKGVDHAKSRLALPADLRRQMVEAMAADTIEAISGSRTVQSISILTRSTASMTIPSDAALVAEPSSTSSLNGALAWFGRERARPEHPIAVVMADLPALRTETVTSLLAMAGDHGLAMVADAAGTGTTILAAADPDHLQPHFGPTSAAAHQAAGAVQLRAPADARCDVDTVSDLLPVRRLGLGARTDELVGRLSAGGSLGFARGGNVESGDGSRL